MVTSAAAVAPAAPPACRRVDQRKQADGAGEDHGGFKDAGGGKAKRGAFVLPLEDRVQRDGGADAGQGDDHLEEAAHEHARVGAGADDPVPMVLHGRIEGECGDRDEGDQVEDARDEGGLPCRARRISLAAVSLLGVGR